MALVRGTSSILFLSPSESIGKCEHEDHHKGEERLLNFISLFFRSPGWVLSRPRSSGKKLGSSLPLELNVTEG